jgi:AcrR family transcriptional regulator
MKYDTMSQHMTKNVQPHNLQDRQTDLTRRLILQAALALLEEQGVAVLTNRTIAERAGISERTVYRHFATRDAMLDALAVGISERLDLPPVPATLAGLVGYPAALYARYEVHATLTQAALHPDVFDRIRGTLARRRWDAIKNLLAQEAHGLSGSEQAVLAANIRFFLAATAWHYYRSHFGFSFKDTVAAVSTAIRQLLVGLPGAGAADAKSPTGPKRPKRAKASD